MWPIEFSMTFSDLRSLLQPFQTELFVQLYVSSDNSTDKEIREDFIQLSKPLMHDLFAIAKLSLML